MVRERREKAKQVREKQTMRGHRGQKGIERERERKKADQERPGQGVPLGMVSASIRGRCGRQGGDGGDLSLV